LGTALIRALVDAVRNLIEGKAGRLGLRLDNQKWRLFPLLLAELSQPVTL
jgi:hypothetical protein